MEITYIMSIRIIDLVFNYIIGFIKPEYIYNNLWRLINIRHLYILTYGVNRVNKDK